MVTTREQAARNAEDDHTNIPGMCQQQTRQWFDAPSSGDQDSDGDADALDGWKDEPAWARHPGDRNPPRGVPLSWAGGHGHRAISLGNRRVRSTDVPRSGVVGTVDIDWFERNWGKVYLGWSETISGVKIPLGTKPNPVPPPQPSSRVARAYALLKSARDRALRRGYKARAAEIQQAMNELADLPDAQPAKKTAKKTTKKTTAKKAPAKTAKKAAKKTTKKS
jgi:hypothetical protein